MSFGMNHALGAGLIIWPVDLQSSALALYCGCPLVSHKKPGYRTSGFYLNGIKYVVYNFLDVLFCTVIKFYCVWCNLRKQSQGKYRWY